MREKLTNLKSNKAITLIALVITIIVLLILAGVTIATLTGDNELLKKASSAKDANSNAEIEEKIMLAYNSAIIENNAQNINMVKSISNNLKADYPNNKVTDREDFIRIKLNEDIIYNLKNGKLERLPIFSSGLYDENNNQIYNWNELLERNYLTVTNGILTSSATNSANPNVDNLVGKLVIDKSVKKIGINGLTFLSNLTEVIIPEGVTTLDINSFRYCSKLTSIEIPEGVTSIKDNAFGGCSSLKYIEFPETLIEIRGGSFENCNSLKKVFIPKNLTTLNELFSTCSSLNSIDVDVDNLNYASIDGVLFDKNIQTLIKYPIGRIQTEYNIPKTVTKIGYLAFWNCPALKHITLSGIETEIGQHAFNYCKALENITISSSISIINSQAFYGCSKLTEIIYNDVKYTSKSSLESDLQNNGVILGSSVFLGVGLSE